MDEGSDWKLLKFIPCDFVIDGFVLINNSHISKFDLVAKDDILKKVLGFKKINTSIKNEYSLSDKKNLFKTFMESEELVQIFTNEEDVSYVGKVIKVNEKSFRLKMLSINAKWLKDYSFTFKSLRCIYFRNDYLKSLSLVL